MIDTLEKVCMFTGKGRSPVQRKNKLPGDYQYSLLSADGLEASSLCRTRSSC